ncbi:metabolite traffic protein EboE [Actinomadura rudentiformis]|uniref:TIM barrel protein n=1 Tax=Actinomadura rudentiformis TaxID=359158 RepID=A0A6H9YYB1_9ACTN|nr:metabolite traffic protein EboE [Actinomadura rudentiformis]KAB2352434.1 TIM barrel protein [Actinomadura rudentiformis]
MRFHHADGTVVHLAYCTNVHAAESLDGVIAQLGRYAGPIRRRLGVPRLGVGLWLARDVASALVGDRSRTLRLRRALDDHGLEVVTFNGFPYRGFHSEVVKHAVYHPDWTTRERLRHTLDLARILAGLLPDDVHAASISTLPLAWRTPWTPAAAASVARNLEQLNKGLTDLAAETGRSIRVAFEPEPGCVVESTDQAVRHLTDTGDHLGVCLDACHLAVGFEEPASAVAKLAAADLQIFKLQASCALHVENPRDPAARRALARFAEPRFLHQTREGDHAVGTDDLDLALEGELPGEHSWRVHFHVPLHASPPPPLSATTDTLMDAFTALFGGPRALTHHVEVETYTWEVLPHAGRDLVEGIAAELAWTRDRLVGLGLKEEDVT